MSSTTAKHATRAIHIMKRLTEASLQQHAIASLEVVISVPREAGFVSLTVVSNSYCGQFCTLCLCSIGHLGSLHCSTKTDPRERGTGGHASCGATGKYQEE
jgi:hypothetical protein